MRIVRIDRVAPGGVALDLHPRMTVLADAPPEMRRRLHEVFRSLSSDDEPAHGGLVEVNGVRLTLDRATLDQLQLDDAIDPILVLGSVGAAAADVNRALLREQLRSVSVHRSELAEQMRLRRDELDPGAGAAVEVCLGQIDVLESRRTKVRAEWEQERADADERRRSLIERREHLRAVAERLDEVDAAEVIAAGDALARAVEPPSELDPVALRLADHLEQQLGVLRELVGRRASLELREREAAQRLDEAVAAAHSAAARDAGAVDGSVVSRLEQVRDEIFSVGDRAGRLGASRSKRRVSELRAEEAVLLDRLGYETYSAYVMGIPSLRAEMERTNRIDSAENRSDRIEAELEDLRADLPDTAEIRRAAEDLLEALSRSLDHLGDPRSFAVDATEIDPSEIERHHAELVYATLAELRQRRVSATSEDAPHVLIAIDRLRRALAAATGDWPEGVQTAEGVVVERFGVDTLPSAPGPLSGVAREWSAWFHSLGDVALVARGQLAALESELAALEQARTAGRDTSRWAEVEAALDAALDRLSVAQERLRLHDSATAAIAALRDEELSVRSDERRLLSGIAEADRLAPVSPHPPPYRPPATDGPDVSDTTSGRAPTPLDAEWQVITHLAEQRSVSFAGSVPVLVDGLPDDTEAASAVLGRLHALSDLVQVVLLAEQRDVALDLVDLTSATVTVY